MAVVLAVLARRYDLGVSQGNSVESIELVGTGVTAKGLASLQERLPDTRILH